MMNHKHLSNQELHQQTLHAAKTEQRATYQLLQYLREVEARKLFAQRGYDSLFAYVVKELKYSEACASERIAAMRLLRELPQAEVSLATGELNLSTAAKLQHFFRAEEKWSGKKIDVAAKHELVVESTGKSKRELEQLLLTKTKNIAAVVPTVRIK